MDYNVSLSQDINSATAGVISRMFMAVALTMFTAAVISAAALVPVLFGSFLGYVIIFAPLLMSLYLAWRSDTLSDSAIKSWFFAFAAVMGLSLSLLVSIFTTASIVIALVSTTASFGALAAWGYTTKRDLSGWGPFLFAGVIGLIVASVIGIFIDSTALQQTLNVLTVVIFLGLTAYDMNRIRESYWLTNQRNVDRWQWQSALSLYINFINIFVSLLQLMGNRE